MKRPAKIFTRAITLCAILFCSRALYSQVSAPPQPEAMGFESIGNPDMVDLSTGDFVYSIPVVHVPGDGGGFSASLSYNAGIKLNQESSWVGLGWSLNPGAINRNVNNYPDDFNGEIVKQHYYHPGGHGWGFDFMGFNLSYDSEKGRSGSIGYGGFFKLGFYNDKSLRIAGIGNDSNGDPAFNIMEFGLTIISIATMGTSDAAAATTDAVANVAASEGSSWLVEVGKNAASELYIKAIGSAMNSNTPNLGGLWEYKKTDLLMFKKYRYYINANVEHSVFGTLNLQNTSVTEKNTNDLFGSLTPLVNKNGTEEYVQHFVNDLSNSVTSDMHIYVDDDTYAYVIKPTSLSSDMYMVNGNGISGQISPYRLDMGSLAYPTLNNLRVQKYNPVPFVQNKPNFRYNGEISNYYDYHQSSDEEDPYGLGVSYINYQPEDTCNCNYELINWPRISVNDSRLKNNRTAPNRDGLVNGIIDNARKIIWYKNRETYTGMNFYAEALDYFDGNRTLNRDNYPDDGIGGFTIIREDGFKYHYALPVYNNYEKHLNKSGEMESWTETSDPYAVTWLLTSITGPDFVDRNENDYPDENDWGYWVRFEYGKFNENISWQNPPSGSNYSPKNINARSFSYGYREQYYLDAIHTRTHTSLFIKSTREDGKRRDLTANFTDTDISLSYTGYSKHSLRLDDIVTIKKEAYDYLTSANGLNMNKNTSGSSTNGFYDNIWDKNDIGSYSNANALWDYITQNMISRNNFEYSYNLCKDFPNAGTSSGKLTLERLNTFGRNNSSTNPGYLFSYGDENDNPNYAPDKWDGWGLYKSDGTNDVKGHLSNSDGDEWSLKEVVTPLGAKLKIEYERDSYGKLLDYNVNTTYSVNYINKTITFTNVEPSDYLAVGETYMATITYLVNIPLDENVEGDIHYEETISANLTITDITNMVVSFETNRPLDLGTFVRTVSINFPEYHGQKYGDGLRVKKISLVDEFGNKYSTKYSYIDKSRNISSGVCTQEPEFSKTSHNALYSSKIIELSDFYAPQVYYKNVVVVKSYSLNGVESEEESKIEYQFITPSISDFSESSTSHNLEYNEKRNTSQIISVSANQSYSVYLKSYMSEVEIFNNPIGSPSIINEYVSNELVQTTEYEYFSTKDISLYDPTLNKMGKYTEGSILAEGISDHGTDYLRLFRSLKTYYGSLLSKVVYKSPSGISEVRNTKFDFLTGQVLEKENENITEGIVTKTVTTPAYHVYPDMKRKNMKSQKAAKHIYLIENNIEKPIQASINTWYAWSNYNIWRKHQNYVWKGELNDDGSYKNFVDFSWEGTPDAAWQKTSEITQYNNYSMPIESYDINQNYSSQLIGYNKTKPIAVASNARLNEIAYTGFEVVSEYDTDNWDFESDITATKTTTNQSSISHTGDYSVSVNGNGPQFSFALKRYGAYMASVWARTTNGASGKLKASFYNSNNAINQTIECTTNNGVFTSGSWVLLQVIVSAKDISGQPTQFNLESSGGAVYFDDFRVQPIDAGMNTYVYDQLTDQVTAILDNNNIATVYEYDDAGRLVRTKTETPSGFEKVNEYEYNYARAVNLPSKLEFGFASETKTIQLEQNGSFAVAQKPSWIELVTFDANNLMTITTMQNPNAYQNNSTLIIYKDNSPNEIEVSQDPLPFKLVGTYNQSNYSYEGETRLYLLEGTVNISVTAPSWVNEAKVDYGWKIADELGTTINTIIDADGDWEQQPMLMIRVNPNANFSEYSGTIELSSGGHDVAIDIAQNAKPILINYSLPSSNFKEYGETKTITVNSNHPWTIESLDPDMCQIRPTPTTDIDPDFHNILVGLSIGSSVSIDVKVNSHENLTTRTCSLKIVAGNEIRYLEIVQDADDAYLNLNKGNQTVSYSAGNINLTTTSNFNWNTAVSYSGNSSNWVSVSPGNGEDASVTINYEANSLYEDRTATVTFSGQGVSKSIAITQTSAPYIIPEINSVTINQQGSVNYIYIDNNVASITALSTGADWLKNSHIRMGLTPTEEQSVIDDPNRNSENYLVIDAPINNRFEENTEGEITLSGSGIETTISLSQDSKIATLSTNVTSKTLDASGNNTTDNSIVVTSNVPTWYIDSRNTASWLHCQYYYNSVPEVISDFPEDNTNLYGVYFWADNYDATSDRSTSFKIIAEDKEVTITVTQSGAAPRIIANDTYHVFSYKNASAKQITIESNLTWSRSISYSGSATGWLTVTPSSGSDATLSITAQDNNVSEERTATITLSGGNTSETINIRQNPKPYIAPVFPQVYLSQSSDKEYVQINSNVPWTASDNASWLTVKNGIHDDQLVQSGIDNPEDYVVIEASSNTTFSDRNAVVTLTGSDASSQINVKQSGRTATLSVSTNSLDFSHIGGQAIFQRVTISSNTNYYYLHSLNDSWIHCKYYFSNMTTSDDPVPPSGATLLGIQIYLDKNSGLNQRTGDITIRAGDKEEVIAITQNGTPPTLSISPSSVSKNSSSSAQYVTVTSNASWVLSESCSWITPNSTSGTSGSKSVKLNLSENTSFDDRSYTITFTANGTLNKSLTVTQEGKPIVLAVNPINQPVTYNGGVFTFQVTSNIPWEINEDYDWLNILSVEGDSGNGQFTVGVYQNTTTVVRLGTIYLKPKNKTSPQISFTISQEPGTGDGGPGGIDGPPTEL